MDIHESKRCLKPVLYSVWVPGFPSIVVRCGFVLGWEGCGGRVFCPGPSSSSVSVSSPGPISSVVSGVASGSEAACQPMTLCHHQHQHGTCQQSIGRLGEIIILLLTKCGGQTNYFMVLNPQ